MFSANKHFTLRDNILKGLIQDCLLGNYKRHYAMKQMANIYCIIVTFNGERWIEQCLNSVVGSSIKCSTIVIDNQSSDDTIQIIKSKFPQIKLIQNEKNIGFGKANNIGINLAIERGADYFFFLNQDAWVETDTISKLVEAHDDQPLYGILSPLHLYNNQKLDKKFKSYLGGTGDEIIDRFSSEGSKKIIDVKFINAAIWSVSRECIDEIGLFAPIFDHYAEDLNFVHRCKYHNIKAGVLPHAKAYHVREQNPTKGLKIALKRQLTRDKSYWQGILLNINHSFIRQMLYLFLNCLKEIIKSIFLFRFKTIFVIGNRVKCLPLVVELNIQRGEMKKKRPF